MSNIEKTSNLEMYRKYAQYFTMAAAILYGLLWIFTATAHTAHSNNIDKFSGVLLACIILGGVVMGLLYTVHLSRKK